MLKNEWHMAGNAGQDVTIKSLNNGGSVASFQLAYTYKGKDAQASKTTWVSVRAFGDQAKAAAAVRKGSNVYVFGPGFVDEYIGKDGTKKLSVGITANFLSVVERPEGGYKKGGDFVPFAGDGQEFGAAPVRQVAPPALYDAKQLDDIPF